MNIRPERWSTAGFSLIELLVVLVVAGLVVSMAGPSMASYIGRDKTRRALDQIAGDLAYARIMAIRGGERISVVFTSGDDYIIRDDDTGDPVKSVNLALEYPGVNVTAPTGNGELTFDSRGLLQSHGSGTIVVAMGDVADTLLVSAAGRVYRDY